MAGSGTTLVAARLRGHHAIGFDTDPLALTIAKAWCSDVDPKHLRAQGQKVLREARKLYRDLKVRDAYPRNADIETRAFVRFWFDPTSRRQLTALAAVISQVKNSSARTHLWSSFSRLIITKECGASLAMDVSHSRPHKVYTVAPVKPLEQFLSAIEAVLRGSPFSSEKEFPSAVVRSGDARKLPLRDKSIDLVVTSPPYLNAIDYLRGHKLSLVWMGHQIGEIRRLRAQNIGAESAHRVARHNPSIDSALKKMGDLDGLSDRSTKMLARYANDMNAVIAEISRVLKRNGKAVIVIGNSMIRGTFIQNSRALAHLAQVNGLTLTSTRRRPLLENRRYLPPPGKKISGNLLRSRMNEEVILTFAKG